MTAGVVTAGVVAAGGVVTGMVSVGGAVSGSSSAPAVRLESFASMRASTSSRRTRPWSALLLFTATSTWASPPSR